MQYPWNHNRRFNAYANYVKKEFGDRIQKLTIDAGFTCPNRNGSLGYGGCSYCNNDAFNPSYCDPNKPVIQQIEEGIEFHETRYRRATKYLAYFQAYSNTYMSLQDLKKIYQPALIHDKVVGLVIGTRPDCVDDEKLDYFQHLSRDYYILIEYGIESCNNATLERINRGHTFEQSIQAIEETSKRGIKNGAHIIFGLPGETRDDMLNEAAILSRLPLTTLKLHQLQIIKGTRMAEEFKQYPEHFCLFQLKEYLDFITDFIERLHPKILIERIAGEVPPKFVEGPDWGLIRNYTILDRFEKKLERRNTWQGRLYKEK